MWCFLLRFKVQVRTVKICINFTLFSAMSLCLKCYSEGKRKIALPVSLVRTMRAWCFCLESALLKRILLTRLFIRFNTQIHLFWYPLFQNSWLKYINTVPQLCCFSLWHVRVCVFLVFTNDKWTNGRITAVRCPKEATRCCIWPPNGRNVACPLPGRLKCLCSLTERISDALVIPFYWLRSD